MLAMLLLDSIGWKATGLRNRIVDRIWERRLGIDTYGSVEVDQPDANRYDTFAYSSILNIIDHLNVQSDDVFVDIGCGKGRVVCCAALHNLRKVVGVDIDRGLCEQAKINAGWMQHRRAPVEIVNAGAQEFDYRECTAFFLGNSFGAATLKQVLASINQSLRVSPRRIHFAYVNPVHDALLREGPGFEKYDQWRRRPWSGLKFDVSFWRVGRDGQ